MQIDSTQLFAIASEIRRSVNQIDALPDEPTISDLSAIAEHLEEASEKLRELASKLLDFEIKRHKAEEKLRFEHP